MRPDLVEPQDGLNALMQEVRLPEQTAAVQGHQLLVEVHGEHVEVETSLHVFCLPQGHGAQRASCEKKRKSNRCGVNAGYNLITTICSVLMLQYLLMHSLCVQIMFLYSELLIRVV